LFFFSPSSIALQADYVTVVEDRPIMSAKYRLPLLAKTDPRCSAVSAIVELLVNEDRRSLMSAMFSLLLELGWLGICSERHIVGNIFYSPCYTTFYSCHAFHVLKLF